MQRPWHTQIHRDAFSYGEVGPKVDPRIVVDLRFVATRVWYSTSTLIIFFRFFGMQSGVSKNRIIFEKNITDAFGMPQATFEYTPTDEHALEANRMMNE